MELAPALQERCPSVQEGVWGMLLYLHLCQDVWAQILKERSYSHCVLLQGLGIQVISRSFFSLLWYVELGSSPGL